MTERAETMVERVARALYAAGEGCDQAANVAHFDYWFGDDPEARAGVEDYRVMARAALDAVGWDQAIVAAITKLRQSAERNQDRMTATVDLYALNELEKAADRLTQAMLACHFDTESRQ
jgi:hypothetical protein